MNKPLEMTMVEYWEMGDKQSQQRRRRADGAVRSVADRSAVEENRAPAPPNRPNNARVVVRGSRIAVCLEGILWILRSGAPLRSAGEIAIPSTCWRRLRDWQERGIWLNIWRSFLSELNERQQLKWSRIVSGRELRSCEKRGWEFGKTKRGKGTKWMVVVDGRGLPLGNYLHSASPAEVKLAETTLAAIRVGHGVIRRAVHDRNRCG